MKTVEITDKNIEDILTFNSAVVIDYFATWCGPCKILAPTLDELSAELDGKVVIGKLDVDDNPEATVKYGVKSLPTIIFYKDGEVVGKSVGVVTKATLLDKIKAAGLLD